MSTSVYVNPASDPLSAVSTPPPVLSEPFVQKGRKTLIVLVWITAIIGAIAVVIGAYAISSGAGAALAVVYSLIPLPVLFLVYWWIDRVEPEPLRYKIAAFVWGAVIAVIISLLLESLVSVTGVSENWQIAFFAPVIEEAAKGLFLVLVMVRARRIIRGVIDGILIAGLVAVGFAAVENIVYYAASYLGLDEAVGISGFEAATATFVIRGLFSPFAHPLFTTAIGIAMGLTAGKQSWTIRALAVVLGYLGSVALHAMWNGSIVITGIGGFFVVYLLLAGMLVALFIVIVILRNRELRALEKSLYAIAQSGWIHPDEVPHLVRFPRRKGARTYAKNYGPYAFEAMKQYQELATLTAFLYENSLTNRGPKNAAELCYARLEQMWSLRPWLRFPPAIPPAIPLWYR